MTVDDFNKKLQKLTESYRKIQMLDDNSVNGMSEYLKSGDKAQFYKSKESSNSDYGNKISHSVYESNSNFLNKKILDLKEEQIVYIKTTNDIYLKSSDDGVLSLEKLENLDKTFEWKIKMNTKGYEGSSNSIEIFDFKDKKIKVDSNKKINSIKQEESSRFTKWKIKKFDKYFLLESFKHKDYHIDASNISTLNYDIKETSKWNIVPIFELGVTKNMYDDITINDRKTIDTTKIEIDKIVKELKNTYLILQYLEVVKSKGTARYDMYIQKYINNYNIYELRQKNEKAIETLIQKKREEVSLNNSKISELKTKLKEYKIDDEIDKYKEAIQKLKDDVKKKKSELRSMNWYTSKETTEKKINALLLSVETQNTKTNEIKTKIETLTNQKTSTNTEIQTLKKKINEINEDYNSKIFDLRNINIYKKNIATIKERLNNSNFKNDFIDKIDNLINIYERSKEKYRNDLNKIYVKIDDLYTEKDFLMRQKKNDYDSSFLKNKRIVMNFEKNIDNDKQFDSEINKINENKIILKNNIEYLKETDKYLNRKKYMLFGFACLLFIVGIAVIISFFINIYLMFK